MRALKSCKCQLGSSPPTSDSHTERKWLHNIYVYTNNFGIVYGMVWCMVWCGAVPYGIIWLLYGMIMVYSVM